MSTPEANAASRLPEATLGPHYVDRLIAWLAGDDERKIMAATTLFCRIGEPATEFLALEAVRPGRRPHHIIRILDVVQRLGNPLGPDGFFSLQSLLQHGDPAVREKVAKVFLALSPAGLPDSPSAEALLLAHHPAFWRRNVLTAAHTPARTGKTQRHDAEQQGGRPKDVQAGDEEGGHQANEVEML